MSQMPSPSARTYGPKSVLVMAAVCLAFGGAFYLLYRQVLKQGRVADHDHEHTAQVVADLEVLKRDTARVRESLPQAQEELKKRMAEFEQEHRAITDQLRTLRLAATNEGIERDRRAAKVAEVRRLGADIRQTLQTLKQTLPEWKAELESPSETDLGKQLAAEPSRLTDFANLADAQTVSDGQIAGWEEQVTVRLRSIDKESPEGDGEVLVTSEFMSELQQIDKDVKNALADLQRRRATLTALLTQAKQTQPVPDAPDLKQALEAYRQQRDTQREAQIKAETKQVEDEYTRKLAEERAKTEKELGEARLETERNLRDLQKKLLEANANIESQIMSDAVAEVQRKEVARRAALAKAIEKDIRKAKFTAALPDIEQYLVPFITPGQRQLDGSVYNWRFTDTFAPLSLGALRGVHALDNDQNGYQAFLRVAAGGRNDRPKGVFPAYDGRHVEDRQIPLIRKAQLLLEEFGEMLIEEKKLLR